MRLRALAPLFAVLAAAACNTSGGSSSLASAAIATAVAVTAAGVSRAQGGCVAACPPGTACNPATGFCDPLPCRGACQAHEWCEKVGRTERCVRARSADLEILVPAGSGARTADLPLAAPAAAPAPATPPSP